jgi:NitT/TauT family transport system ATP-binding protein/sulfonate transport system ATP-binding protein
MSKLAIRGVSRVFAGVRGRPPVQALEPIDLAVADNDFICILGPSGCGKSTLLRIVAGLAEPSAGTVVLDGRPIDGPGRDRGMVFQSYTLFRGHGAATSVSASTSRPEQVPSRTCVPTLIASSASRLRGPLSEQPGWMQQRWRWRRAPPTIGAAAARRAVGALDNQTPRALMQGRRYRESTRKPCCS